MDRHLESLPLFEEEVNIYNTNTNNTNNNNNNNNGNGEYEYTKGSGFGTDYRNSNTYLRGKNVAQLVRGGGASALLHTNTSNTSANTNMSTSSNIPTANTNTTNTNTTPTSPLPAPAVSSSQVEVTQQQQHAQSFQVASGNSTKGGGGGGGEAHLHTNSSTDTHSDLYTPPQPTVDNNNSNNNVNISHVHTEDRCSASDDNIENIADTQPPVIHPTSGSDLSLLPPVPPLPDQSVYSEADLLTVYTSNEPDAGAGTGPKNPPHLSPHTTTTTNTHEPQHPQHPLPTTTTTHTNNTIQFEQPQLGFKGAMVMMAELSKAVSRLKDDLFMFYFTDPNPNPVPATACALDQHSASVSFPVSGPPLYTSTMDTGDGDSVHPTYTTMSYDEEEDVFSQLEQHPHEHGGVAEEEGDGSDKQHDIMNSCNNSTTLTTAAPTTTPTVPTTANATSNTTGRSRRGRKKGSGTGTRHIHTRHAKLHEYERNYITPHCISLLTTSITSTDTSDPDPTILSPFVDSRHTFLGRHLLHLYDATLYISIYMLHLLYILFILYYTILYIT